MVAQLKVCGILLVMALLSACEHRVIEASTQNNDSNDDQRKSSRAHTIPERRLEGVPKTGVELGMGWDSRRGEVVPNHCLNFSPIRASGQEISVSLTEVSDQSEMMDSLKVGAEVSVKSMFGSGNAKANFARNSKIQSNNTTLLLQATVENGVLFIGPPEAPAMARSAFPDPGDQTRNLKTIVESIGLSVTGNGQLLTQSRERASKHDAWPSEVSFKPEIMNKIKHPNQFREHCGDYFVSAVFSGAQLLATISFQANSKAQSSDISASVEADFGVISGSANTQANNQNSNNSTRMEMKFTQIGGGPGMIPTSKEALQQKLRELAIEASGNPKFHTIELRSYREIAESDGLVFNSRDAEFESVSDYYWLLSSVYDEIESIREQPNDYFFMSGLTLDQLLALQDEILEVRRALYEIMDAFFAERMPDKNILEAVEHQWFPGKAGETFVLDLIPGAALTANNSDASILCDDSQWFTCLINKFDRAVPYRNPNTIRLLLPLPINQTDAGVIDDIEDYKAAVLEYYIRRQSSRMCDLDPTDNECMSNAEINDLAGLIPVNPNQPPADNQIRNQAGDCLALTKTTRAFAIQNFNQIFPMNHILVTKPCKGSIDETFGVSKGQFQHLKTKECVIGSGKEAFGSVCPISKNSLNDWVFHYTGHIALRSAKTCLTAPEEAGHSVHLETCQFNNPLQRWHTVTDNEKKN